MRSRFKDPRKLEKEFKPIPNPVQKSQIALLLEVHVIPSIATLIESYNSPLLIVPKYVKVKCAFSSYCYETTQYDAIDPITGYHKEAVNMLEPKYLPTVQPLIIKNELYSLAEHFDDNDGNRNNNGYDLYCTKLDTMVTICIGWVPEHVTLGTLNDRLYIVGYKRHNEKGKCTSVVQLDTTPLTPACTTDSTQCNRYKFVQVSTTVYPRHCANIVSTNSHMFVIGGIGFSDTIEVFDGRRWTLLDVRLDRFCADTVHNNAVIIDYKIYVKTHDVVQVYDMTSKDKRSSSFGLPSTLPDQSSNRLVAFKNKLILVSHQWNNHVCYYCYDERAGIWNKLSFCHDSNIYEHSIFVI